MPLPRRLIRLSLQRISLLSSAVSRVRVMSDVRQGRFRTMPAVARDRSHDELSRKREQEGED